MGNMGRITTTSPTMDTLLILEHVWAEMTFSSAAHITRHWLLGLGSRGRLKLVDRHISQHLFDQWLESRRRHPPVCVCVRVAGPTHDVLLASSGGPILAAKTESRERLVRLLTTLHNLDMDTIFASQKHPRRYKSGCSALPQDLSSWLLTCRGRYIYIYTPWTVFVPGYLQLGKLHRRSWTLMSGLA